MLNQNFALNLSASLSGSPFSFDELIQETKGLFEREGVPGFLRVLLLFIDDFVITHWYEQHGKNCCESPCFRRAGKKSKNLLTTIGQVCFEWTLLRCKACGKTHNPLKSFFELATYQRIVRISAISSISATRVSPLENTMSALKGHLLGCLLIILTRTRVKFTELSYLAVRYRIFVFSNFY